MLYLPAIKPDTLDILIRLQQQVELADTRLVGGTALALQLGHRLSVDIDLAFLLDRHPVEEIVALYHAKYPKGSEYLVLRSLVYFDDAEDDPMPVMLKPMKWEDAKEKIMREVRRYSLTQ
ncbi:MAG: nucleotidyl transferase AbiEii/AbiGii toxin family protein [Kiritimatiellae bacterium]|jgi:hypothetical protein|nr:nucleotidyl transferase AbiEii/AbiGii toxin family protein [Kiritimatiellia bacterium]